MIKVFILFIFFISGNKATMGFMVSLWIFFYERCNWIYVTTNLSLLHDIFFRELTVADMVPMAWLRRKDLIVFLFQVKKGKKYFAKPFKWG
jgi:hypothetical protein